MKTIFQYDMVYCAGLPKTGTTFLWDCLANDDRFSVFKNSVGTPIKEPAEWNKISNARTPTEYVRHNYEKVHTTEEYYNWLNSSKKPCLDFSIAYQEAMLCPSSVNEINSNYDIMWVMIIRDPLDILISAINFDDNYGIISHSKSAQMMREHLQHPKLQDLFNLPKYSLWLPSWLTLCPDMILLDYNRLNDCAYINSQLRLGKDQLSVNRPPINVTAKKLLHRDRLNSELLNVLQDYYAEDREYICSLKDKY